MQFRVLGPVEVAVGAQRADVGGGHQRTILAVLLAAGGRTVATDALIDALWGDHPPATARKSLQSHLARLRSALAAADSRDHPEVVVSEPDGYGLRLEGHELDARRFEDLVARARTVADEAPPQALRLLDEAGALVRGPAYGELASHPAVAAEALRLEHLQRAAAADRLDVCLALGRHGVDPSAPLRERYERILWQDPQLTAPGGDVSARVAAGPSAAAEPSSPTASPKRPAAPELVGRADDAAAVARRLALAPLVTLTGPGGVGKTRLAETVAAGLAEDHDEVVTCGLAAVRDPQAVVDALITALGIRPTGEATGEQTVTAALGDRRLLLLLDNCEHVLSTVVPLVEAILRRCPQVVMLATSRERLHLPEELVWQVAPLGVPGPGAGVEEVAGSAAGTLFATRARAIEPAFELTPANADAVAELCRRLDGMPLAIELAAARVGSMTPADLVTRLDRRFSLLAGGPRRQAGRHRTLQAVVAWSHDLLEDDEAELFQRLSVFAGSFSLEAAERVCAGFGMAETDVAGLLANLVDRSMVTAERRGELVRYRLLDTLRAFGAQRLAAAGREEAWRRSHAREHVALTERLGPRIRGPGEPEAAADIDAAIDDLRAAHAWLIVTGDVDGALRLPAALGEYVFFRVRDEITTWARRALALPAAAEQPAHAAALTAAAQGATNRDECARAAADATLALRRAGEEGAVALAALWALGTAAFYEGRLDEVGPIAERQAQLADRLDEPFYGAFAAVLRVLAHSYRGDGAAAAAALPALEETAAAADNPTMRAFAWYCRGEVHLDGHPEEVVRAFERSIELAREVGNALVEGVSRVSLASLLGRRGDARQALRLFRDVVGHWQRLGDHTHQLTTVRNLVELLARVGADQEAAELYGAVTAGMAPSFGAEAQRLADAWEQVAERLGPQAARAVERGRGCSPSGTGKLALQHLDALLDA